MSIKNPSPSASISSEEFSQVSNANLHIYIYVYIIVSTWNDPQNLKKLSSQIFREGDLHLDSKKFFNFFWRSSQVETIRYIYTHTYIYICVYIYLIHRCTHINMKFPPCNSSSVSGCSLPSCTPTGAEPRGHRWLLAVGKIPRGLPHMFSPPPVESHKSHIIADIRGWGFMYDSEYFHAYLLLHLSNLVELCISMIHIMELCITKMRVLV